MICFSHLILLLATEAITFSQAVPPTMITKYDDVSLTVQSKKEDELIGSNKPSTPSISLEVPREQIEQAFYFDYPAPSEDLELPSTQPWNPNNDSKYYFELPSSITKQASATNVHPKKYNKYVHEKRKPFNSKPKEEITLIPISEKKYLMKQQASNKRVLNLVNSQAKAQNKVHNLKDDNESQANSYNQGFVPPNSNNRFEFQMHGYDGPLSYKWGYDTGKGHNRQFRYEERNKHGFIRGHYGYSDKNGKLRVVNYSADPQDGFSTEDNTKY